MTPPPLPGILIALLSQAAVAFAFVVPPAHNAKPSLAAAQQSTIDVHLMASSHIEPEIRERNDIEIPKTTVGIMSKLTSNQLSMLLAMEKEQRGEFLSDILRKNDVMGMHQTSQQELELATKVDGHKHYEMDYSKELADKEVERVIAIAKSSADEELEHLDMDYSEELADEEVEQVIAIAKSSAEEEMDHLNKISQEFAEEDYNKELVNEEVEKVIAIAKSSTEEELSDSEVDYSQELANEEVDKVIAIAKSSTEEELDLLEKISQEYAEEIDYSKELANEEVEQVIVIAQSSTKEELEHDEMLSHEDQDIDYSKVLANEEVDRVIAIAKSSSEEELGNFEKMAQEYDETILQELIEASKDMSSSLKEDHYKEIVFDQGNMGKVGGIV